MFWVSGAAGSGKTHFLNFLFTRADASPESTLAGRTLLPVETSGEVGLIALQSYLDSAHAQLEDEKAGPKKRGRVIYLVDFGMSDVEDPDRCAVLLATFAKANECVVIAASRHVAPEPTVSLEVECSDDERALAALKRSRALTPEGIQIAEQERGNWAVTTPHPADTFPFHWRAMAAIQRLLPDLGIPDLSRLLADLLSGLDAGKARWLYESDLPTLSRIQTELAARFGKAATEARRILLESLWAIPAHEREFAREVSDLLLVERALGNCGFVHPSEIARRIATFQTYVPAQWQTRAVRRVLRRLRFDHGPLIEVGTDGGRVCLQNLPAVKLSES